MNKSKNAKIASEEEKYLVNELNNPDTKKSFVFINHFKSKYPSKSSFHFQRKGGRKCNFDIIETTTKETIELKKYSKLKNKPITPLSILPQFFQTNRGKLTEIYAKNWYEYSLPLIKKKLNIKANIPDFDTWKNYDIKQSSNKISDFTKEIKHTISENKKKDKILKNIKYDFVKYLRIDIKNQMKYYQKTVFEDFKVFATESLNKKDNWCIYKDIHNELCYLYDKVEYPSYLTQNDFVIDETSDDLKFLISDKNQLCSIKP